jgi:hypothetical protein
MFDKEEGYICKVPYVEVPVIGTEGGKPIIAGAMEAPDELVMIPEIGQAIIAPQPKEEVEVGDGSLGSVCYENDDCDSEQCGYGMYVDSYGMVPAGTCTCNTTTNVGCDDGYVCSANLIETQRLAGTFMKRVISS